MAIVKKVDDAQTSGERENGENMYGQAIVHPGANMATTLMT